ncbi:hypothetical protein Moror_12488 [Moniliophthora roreri MCA 2997]|uniref:Uncharacterized protein n=2 Tax=Moniliophthora roreri TaxID=221103 RepID=V2YVQ0_MONRO|nr:hypothetical protein Moror_12488 [Moniliophthora roreri MCA 2997]
MYLLRTVILCILPLLSTVVFAAPSRRSPPSGGNNPNSGAIVQPKPGTVVAPGQAFDFVYDTKADYGVSSYNFTVWLFTSPPSMQDQDFATGHYFGRYGLPNYPGNPSPPNLPPAQLVMPDFSKNPGGFGGGATATNQTVYLAVIEEYATGTGTIGLRMNLAINELLYNATSQTGN